MPNLALLSPQPSLRNAGLRPSRRLASLSTRELGTLGSALAKLEPDLPPEPRIVPRVRQQVGALVVRFAVIIVIGGAAHGDGWALGAVALLPIAWLLSRGAPARVEFGRFHTIGEIATAIVSSRQATM